ncbi:FtsK/SpoIIIE domain-containing protein [Streptomonospora wellingtoniae]|uniref:FtsK/SpoIIIE domain-containing protein n=1 Tax=Streptomonospora wellingtoniae TaxID=3075544 RepID=A0ABU2L0H1_9ACTN|nr:FtsK/SpoIIIE domain-containing protein [Streptomonospora sp. DSM 45055]MDT0305044.1 FtsK/SpoIIIE domain-containing protein [Streptomonospora sp. DSM 45055]
MPDQDDTITMGVVWEAGASEAPRGRELVHVPRPAPAADRLRAAAATWNTYAALAWSRRWQTAEAYVQDPDLYRETVDAAREEIRRERAQVAKKLDKARMRKDEAQVRLLSEQLQDLERRAPSALKMDALTLKARSGRLARQAAVPAAITLGPVAALALAGMWWPLLAWPAAWVWLAVQGHGIAVAEGAVSAAEAPAAVEPAAAPPPGAPRGASSDSVGASEQETAILGHLADWDRRSAGRGLDGVTPAPPSLDSLGIRVVLATSGRMTPEKLGKRLPEVRAALALPRGVRADLSPGDVGDQAVLRIRTRTPERDMTWRPGRAGIGVDSDTGRPVVLPKGRMLIAGTSGAGKSVLLRVVMAEALCAAEPTAVVYIDPKGEESGLWRGKLRCANTVDEILAVLAELDAESDERSAIMQQRRVSSWAPTEERPRIVVVVDEGAEIVSMDAPQDDVDLIRRLQPLATMGRSRGIDLVWATQKPLLGSGIPSQLNGVMQDKVVLKTAGRNENNQVLGADWSSHELELGGSALANTGGRGPDQAPIQVWDLSDDAAVLALPDAQPWAHRPAGKQPAEPEGIPPVLAAALALSEGARGVTGPEIADGCGLDLVDVQEALRAVGVLGDRFTRDGVQVRGYRRDALEEASRRYAQ